MPVVFLYAPEDFHNLCLLARTLEVFGQRECYVFDPHQLVKDRYGKVRSRELRAVSSGAFEKIQWLRVADPVALLRAHQGRVVTTVLDSTALPLHQHAFDPTDLILFGPESSGLPPEIVDAGSVSVTIPALGETRSLNLAVSLGIFLFERYRQIGSAGTPDSRLSPVHTATLDLR
jgi:tRNA (cytidine/uridine-2'-O-)-methyltransferase